MWEIWLIKKYVILVNSKVLLYTLSTCCLMKLVPLTLSKDDCFVSLCFEKCVEPVDTCMKKFKKD